MTHLQRTIRWQKTGNGKGASASHRQQASLHALPTELRLIIYRYILDDFLSDFDSERLGYIFAYTGRCDCDNPSYWNKIKRTKRHQVPLLQVCKASALVSRELWPIIFDTMVPEVVCSGMNLTEMLDIVKSESFLKGAVTPRRRFAESLKRFNYIKLSLLCDSKVNGQDFISLLYYFRDSSHRIGLHVCVEDLAIALHCNDWFFNAPYFSVETLRELLWDPRVALFVFEGITREPRWAWTYKTCQALNERTIASTCRALSIDRSKILKSYRPEVMRIGSEWEMRQPPRISLDMPT